MSMLQEGWVAVEPRLTASSRAYVNLGIMSTISSSFHGLRNLALIIRIKEGNSKSEVIACSAVDAFGELSSMCKILYTKTEIVILFLCLSFSMIELNFTIFKGTVNL